MALLQLWWNRIRRRDTPSTQTVITQVPHFLLACSITRQTLVEQFDWTENVCRFFGKSSQEVKQSLPSQEMFAVKWRDRRKVTGLMTMLRDVMVTLNKDRKTQEYVRKPQCVTDYSKKMGAIDHSDMMLSSVECVRKTIKWYKNLFLQCQSVPTKCSCTLSYKNW
jgi:hypothetical protein